MQVDDIIIIGAGPVGLYAAFYAGMRGLSAHIIEVSEQAGGQPTQIYPEKAIFDIPGIPRISGGKLAEDLLKQLQQVDYRMSLGEVVEKILPSESGFTVRTDKAEYQAKSVLLATGTGLLKPRKLGLAQEEAYNAAGRVQYFVKNMEDYRDLRVAVFGGGDSALDWALMLEKVAAEVHLVHRRREFRAHEFTTALVNNSSITIHVPYTPAELTERGILISKVREDEQVELNVDKILVNYGFEINQTTLVDGLELTRNGKLPVSQQMATELAGLYAAGDACEYVGKVPLIVVGFGEAVTAVNAIAQTVKFDHPLRKGHSSTIFAG